MFVQVKNHPPFYDGSAKKLVLNEIWKLKLIPDRLKYIFFKSWPTGLSSKRDPQW
jgi:hypothetical protein